MFERRLKIFLSILFGVTAVLLLRAFQLQVFAKEHWQQEAQGLGHRRHLIETTRGTILDYKGQEIARDEPCRDACVEYGAISKDEQWLREVALKRLAATQPGVYRRADQKQREALLAAAKKQVEQDIDRLWIELAQESKQPIEKIEDLRVSIQQRVQIYERYKKYQK